METSAAEVPQEAKQFTFKVRRDKSGKEIDPEEIVRTRSMNEYYDRMVVASTPALEKEAVDLEAQLQALGTALESHAAEAKADPESMSARMGMKDAQLAIKSTMEKSVIIKNELEKRAKMAA